MTSQPQTRCTYEFGAFRLDPAERLLLRDGQAVSLTPKAFDLLVYLVEHRGRLVDKQALMSALWPDAIVEETNLAYTVSMLRKALGDGVGTSSIIQTVPTRGYRFVAPVTDIAIAEQVAAGRSSTFRLRPLWLTGLGVVLVLIAWFIITRPKPGTSARQTSEPSAPTTETRISTAPRVVPLTTLSDSEDYPAFSPNGEEVVFAWPARVGWPFAIPTQRADANPATQSLYITVVGSTEVRRLTTASAADASPAYSPDGRNIAFLRLTERETRIYLVSVVGGPAARVSDFPATDGLAWSPDGHSLVAGRDGADGGLYRVPVDGGEPQAITHVNSPAHHLYPALSPDGRHLGFVSCRKSDPHFNDCDVEVVNVDASLAVVSELRRLTTMGIIRTLAWTRDGSSLLFAGDAEGPTEQLSLWRVDVTGGRPASRIEAAGANVGGVAAASSRPRVAFAQRVSDADLFAFRAGRAAPLVSASSFDGNARYSNGGRSLSFCSDRSGTMEVWVAAADGSSPRQLTRGPAIHQCSAAWSPDDSHIAFDSGSDDGQWHIWTIAADGGAPRQLTFGPGNQNVPFWSRNGEWIYFAADHGRGIARVRATGGPPEHVTSRDTGLVAFESMDGRLLLYQPTTNDSALLALPLDGGPVRPMIPCVRTGSFAVVRTGIYYVPCGAANSVHVLDTATRRDRVFGRVPGYEPYAGWPLAVAPDGAAIAYTRSVAERADLVLIEDFR